LDGVAKHSFQRRIASGQKNVKRRDDPPGSAVAEKHRRLFHGDEQTSGHIIINSQTRR
jgi:hypothetical protein